MATGSPSVDAAFASFCVSDAEAPECFAMDLATSKLEKAGSPARRSHGALGEAAARVETTATDVNVCVGGGQHLRAVGAEGRRAIEAFANADGTLAVALSGWRSPADAEKGKGAVEISDATKGKKLINVTYAKGDAKSGHARVLGATVFVSAATVFVSADVCAGPAARHAVQAMAVSLAGSNERLRRTRENRAVMAAAHGGIMRRAWGERREGLPRASGRGAPSRPGVNTALFGAPGRSQQSNSGIRTLPQAAGMGGRRVGPAHRPYPAP